MPLLGLGLLLLGGFVYFAGDYPGQSGVAVQRLEVASAPYSLAAEIPLPGSGGEPRVVAAVAMGGQVVSLDAGRGEFLVLEGDEITARHLMGAPEGAALTPQFTDLTPSDTGTLLVTDLANGQVWQYAADGRWLGALLDEEQRTEAGLAKPTAIAKDRQGRLMVADVSDHTIKVFDKLGTLTGTIGGSGPGPSRLSFPNDVTLGPDGLIYVADSNNRRVQVFEEETGRLVRVLSQTETAMGLALPRSLAFDAAQRLHVVDGFQERVSVFDLEGDFLFSYGHLGPAAEKLSLPRGVVVLDDRTLVIDGGNGRLALFAEDR